MNLGCDPNLQTNCPVEERSAYLMRCLIPSVNVTSRRLLLFVGSAFPYGNSVGNAIVASASV